MVSLFYRPVSICLLFKATQSLTPFIHLSYQTLSTLSSYFLSNFCVPLVQFPVSSLSLLLPPPPLPHPPVRLLLSSSHHSVEGPSDIWLSPASRGSRRCRRFWQTGTGTPRGPDGDSWTKKKKKVHIIKCTRSQKHTYALGERMHKQTLAQTERS